MSSHLKPEPPEIATCPHCGNTTPHRRLRYVAFEEVEDLTGEGDFLRDDRWYCLMECGTCKKPSLYADTWAPTKSRWVPALAYPQQLQAPPGLPEAVTREFNQAVAARHVAPGLVAVAVRRVLEAIAADQGAEGHNLNAQIRWLAGENKIPPQLYEMMSVSRTLGNLGAHHGGIAVNEQDVDMIIDFARTIFEYLYVAPAKVAALRQSIDARKGA
jgi:hypothetical protein